MNRLFYLTILVVSIVPSLSFSQANTWKQIAPLVDEETLLIAKVDLSLFDLANGFGLFANITPNSDGWKFYQAGAKLWQSSIRKAGVKEIYIIYGGFDFPNMPLIFMPNIQREAMKTVRDLWQTILPAQRCEMKSIRGFLVIGSKNSLDRLEKRTPKERPDLADAVGASDSFPVQIVLSPSDSARKTLEELAPQLPKSLGSSSTETFTRKLRWIAIGIEGEPDYRLRSIAQCENQQAAIQIGNIWNVWVANLGKETELAVSIREYSPKWFAKLTEILNPKIDNDRILLSIEPKKVIPELTAVSNTFQDLANREKSANAMKQLMIGIHNYHDSFGQLPHDIVDKNGKPLLSWRVAILPFIDEEHLFRQFKLDEPWDSENNRKLVNKMPRVFCQPNGDPKLVTKTSFLGASGKGYFFEPGQVFKISAITDGLSNTIALVQADEDQAVIWSKPGDFTPDAKQPTKGLLGRYRQGFLAALGDGSVRLISKETPQLLTWFTRDGGEVNAEPEAEKRK